MSKLGQVVESVENYNKFVLDQVKRARTDQKFGRDLLGRWNDTKAKIPVTRTPTGLSLPRLALPEIDEPGEIARFIFGEGFGDAFAKIIFLGEGLGVGFDFVLGVGFGVTFGVGLALGVRAGLAVAVDLGVAFGVAAGN